MWNLDESVRYHKNCGAPSDQTALVAFLRELQDEGGGRILPGMLSEAAEKMGVRESYLLAVVKRFPSLRLGDKHELLLCGGPNCGRQTELVEYVERTYGKQPAHFTWKIGPCMRLCGKGPNIKWDGKLYHHADVELLRRLLEK